MNTNGYVTQMRKGLLEFCVLALLQGQPRYGFELVQELGRVQGMLTTEGTIYPLLGRLRREGLVETEWQQSASGPPRRYYRLTEDGVRALAAFWKEWTALSEAVNTIVQGQVLR